MLEGNSAAYAPLEQRLGELLRLDDETESKAVVEAVMAAVRANVIGAKRDVTAAAGTIYREQLGAAEQLTALREEVRQGGETARAERREIVGEIRSRAGGGAAYRLITGKQATALETPKLLAELAEADRLTADEASAALGDSGPAGLASWARTHMDTLSERGAEICARTGRVLMAEREFAVAESLLVLAAEADTEEPGRQWARAASAAFADERPNRGAELLERARDLLKSRHPAVALVELRQGEPTGPEILARLEGVEPLTDGDKRGLATARAQAYLLIEDVAAADKPLREAELLDPESPQVIELRGLWRLQRASAAIAADNDVDSAELEAAEHDFLRLRDEMRRLGRDRESAAMLSRAVEASLDARRIDRAQELLAMAEEHERRAPAALALARQALVCEQPELAIALAREAEGSELARVVEASAEMLGDSSQGRRAAVATLDELLGSADEEVRVEAGLARAIASIDATDGVMWSERAGEILAERDSDMARVLHARVHLAHGELEEAETLMRRSGNDARALGVLVDAAALAGDFDRALQRSEALLRMHRTPETNMQHARLLKRAGRFEQALAELSAVARTREALLPAVREHAYREAADAAQRLDRYTEMEQLCGEAIEAGFSDPGFHWAALMPC